MKYLRFSIMATLSCLTLMGASFAHGADGLATKSELSTQTWPRLQGRLQLNTQDGSTTPLAELRAGGTRLLSASLLGDYYLTGSWLGQRSSGGLRATSGLLVGPMSLTLGGGSLSTQSGLTLNRQSFNLLSLSGDVADYNTTMPYIGIGYTGQSTRGTWGFNADFGLVGIGAKGGLRLGSSASQAQGLDETLREMRFKPVIQMGLSYAF